MELMSVGDGEEVSDSGGGDDDGEGITVVGTHSSFGSGGGGGYSPPARGPSDMPPSSGGGGAIHITVHGHAVTVIHGVAYLTSASGKGIATYQSSSGAYVPIKLSDIDRDIADDTQNLLGHSAGESDYNAAYQQFSEGQSPDQVRSAVAHSSGARAALQDLYHDVLGRDIDASGLTTYETVKNYTSDQLQVVVNGFQETFSSAGNGLDSLMPKSQDHWLGLAATVAVMVTPPGEAVAAADLLAVGGEELLATALDVETHSVVESLAATTTGNAVSVASQSALEELSQFTPRQAGSDLDIGGGITVTQAPGDLNKAGALVFDFKGGNFNSVVEYFKNLTGCTGNFRQKLLNSQNIPNCASIYKVYMNEGYFELKDITNSLGNWTIKLPKRLSNGVREIKFQF
ncbi:hypothetical protein HLH44_14300 [Gluconacetobacter sp. 1c LMG 22058]|uniref:Uncharacterized protein n=1 Tax=Gluconacetobacter dulcium TaxID=2729096 RepID=A0A7W4K1J0_9PROT|nr:hypothetical protein [Gluconacetobacter dulcium]MBB2198612.1 hypothetical protein [Gluconacetobacter dulcium]